MHVNGQANIHANRIETGGVHLTRDENKPPPITTKTKTTNQHNTSTSTTTITRGNNYNTNQNAAIAYKCI